MPDPSVQPRFMLLLRQPQEGPHPTPKEMEQIMSRFTAWMRDLSASGQVVAANGLDDSGKVLRGPRGKTVSDGPYAEAKEIVGGYVLLAAADLDQAIELARGCPGLDYRMVVEVRAIKH